MASLSLIALANHLWQSTLLAAAIACCALLLRKNFARVRYCLWLGASAKFLVPFALLTGIGAQIPWRSVPIHGTESPLLSFAGQMAAHITEVGGRTPNVLTAGAHTASSSDVVAIAVGALWALGALAVAVRWLTRWLRVRRALRESMPTTLTFVTPVRSSRSQLEPLLVGALRPVLLIPQGIDQRLTPEEMRAVLAHERCHVAWRDNLAAALHMLVEVLFWFHPLVWWLGMRLIDERERACDEQVLANGHLPESYAEGILKVCEQYFQSRLACAAGIGGANLRQRIDAIMRNELIKRLSGTQRIMVTLAACSAIIAPIAIGTVTAPMAHAQAEASASDEPTFRNISIQVIPLSDRGSTEPCPGYASRPDGRVTISRCPLRRFIANIYGVSESQVIGKDWSKEPTYEITADDTVTEAADRFAAYRELPAMMRNLLTKQFGLVVKKERRQMDGYVLSVDPAGSKLKTYTGPAWKIAGWMSPDDGVSSMGYSIRVLVAFLKNMYNVPVVDDTGLKGIYEYAARWKPPAPGALPTPGVVATALEEQLGLRLEAQRVTVDAIDVISLKSPTEVVSRK